MSEDTAKPTPGDGQTYTEAPKEETPKEETSKAPPMTFKVEVELPTTQESITVKKLKAGPYYKAQKLYTEWLSLLQDLFNTSRESTKDLKTTVSKDGKVDEKKLEAEIKKELAKSGSKIDMMASLRLADSASDKRINLLAICLDVTVEEVNDKFYPEDINVLLDAAININNFLENVKKSAAPAVGGAKTTN